MRVAVVFPDVPRAVFTTALGWYRAIASDPKVESAVAVNAQGFYGLPEGPTLSALGDVGADVTLVVTGRQVYERMRPGSLPGKHRVLVLTDEPYETQTTSLFNSQEWVGTYGAVYTNDSSTIGLHQSCHYLPCAFDASIKPEHPERKPFDIGFVGSIDERREQWLATLDRTCKGRTWCIVGPKWKPRFWDRAHSLHARVQMNTSPKTGYLGPDEVANLYTKCRVVVNVHRLPGNSPNPRTFDLLGYGVAAVQDERHDTPNSVVQAETPEKMGGLINAYLDGEKMVKELFARSVTVGLECAPDHSYASRWANVRDALKP